LEFTYEEFLDVTDDQLEKKGVTLGARGKILKNISFIRQRPQKIVEILNMLDVSSFKGYKISTYQTLPENFETLTLNTTIAEIHPGGSLEMGLSFLA